VREARVGWTRSPEEIYKREVKGSKGERKGRGRFVQLAGKKVKVVEGVNESWSRACKRFKRK